MLEDGWIGAAKPARRGSGRGRKLTLAHARHVTQAIPELAGVDCNVFATVALDEVVKFPRLPRAEYGGEPNDSLAAARRFILGLLNHRMARVREDGGRDDEIARYRFAARNLQF